MIPIVDVGLAAAVKEGRVRVVPPLDRLRGGSGSARRRQPGRGRRRRRGDGFRTGLEPLVGHLGVLDERGRPLVRDVEEPAAAPGLHFVGYEVTLGGIAAAGRDRGEAARAAVALRASATTA